jgi:hypothetical protein
MTILEVQQSLQVETPKGRGRVWLVTDYGSEIEKLFTVILDSSGEIWEFTNKDVKATSNVTMGRKTCLQDSTGVIKGTNETK